MLFIFGIVATELIGRNPAFETDDNVQMMFGTVAESMSRRALAHAFTFPRSRCIEVAVNRLAVQIWLLSFNVPSCSFTL